MTTTIRLGISTCPNDTFAFHGLLHKLVDRRGLEFDVQLLDIQQLNLRLYQGHFDVAKASFFAALRLSDQNLVLPSGAALGFGVGPLLLAAQDDTLPQDLSQLTLCPGRDTTASLLFRLFFPLSTRLEQVVFSEIMPKLQRGEADFGVCIHEGRFTWQAAGLFLVEDLGARWEAETNCPLPLGGILASRKLEQQTLADVQAVILDSIQLALADPASALPTMRQYAQEFDDHVLMQHVELYVNQWTVDLGAVGQRALVELGARARAAGLVDAKIRELEVFSR